MRVIICLAITLSITMWSGANAASNTATRAATNLDAPTLQRLVQLERNYFGRNYDADSDESRAQRLEKLIYGETAEGDPSQRIMRMNAAASSTSPSPESANSTSADTPGDADKTDKPDQANRTDRSNSSDTTNRSGRSGRNTSLKKREGSVSKAAEQSNDTSDPTDKSESYPHIAALEKAILSRTYAGQPVPARLARMETTAFGKPTANPDLSQRTDALDQYAEQKLHISTTHHADDDDAVETPGSTGSTGSTGAHQAQTQVQTQADSDSTQTDYPHVTSLEKTILGQTFAGQPLADRLSRMETKAFGKPADHQDLSARTDNLERYAEKTLHKQPFDQQLARESGNANPGAKPQSSMPSKLLTMVGSTLLGAAVGSTGIPGGAALGRVAFGGVRAHQRQEATPKQEQPSPPVDQDDPAVHASTAPAPDAKMQIKVGWCEVQVFGHTFPTMHLSERLGQLNTELNFKPGKSGIALMDDVGALIKTVQSQKPTRKSIGSTLQSEPH